MSPSPTGAQSTGNQNASGICDRWPAAFRRLKGSARTTVQSALKYSCDGMIVSFPEASRAHGRTGKPFHSRTFPEWLYGELIVTSCPREATRGTNKAVIFP